MAIFNSYFDITRGFLSVAVFWDHPRGSNLTTRDVARMRPEMTKKYHQVLAEIIKCPESLESASNFRWFSGFSGWKNASHTPIRCFWEKIHQASRWSNSSTWATELFRRADRQKWTMVLVQKWGTASIPMSCFSCYIYNDNTNNKHNKIILKKYLPK